MARIYSMFDPMLGEKYHQWNSLESQAPSITEPPYVLNESDIAKFKQMERDGQTSGRGYDGECKYRIEN